MSSEFEITNKILGKIKDQNIHPIPLWIFRVRRFFLVLIFILSTIFGAFSFSILWINLRLYSTYSQVQIGRGIGSLVVPTVWLLLSILFFIIAYFHYRKSPRGYRTSNLKLFAALATLSFALGTALFLSGYSQKVHLFIRHKIPTYGILHHQMRERNCKPLEGMLCGKIDSDLAAISSTQSLELTDESGQKWQIDISEAEIRGLPRIEIEKRVRIWGTAINQSKFKATDVRPYPLED